MFANQYYAGSVDTEMAKAMTITSPFAANLLIPLEIDSLTSLSSGFAEQFSKIDLRAYWHFAAYVLFTLLLNGALLGVMVWMFNSRWRVSKVGGVSDRDSDSAAPISS